MTQVAVEAYGKDLKVAIFDARVLFDYYLLITFCFILLKGLRRINREQR